MVMYEVLTSGYLGDSAVFVQSHFGKETIMNTKRIVSAILLLSFASCGAFADRPLERAEILQILQDVTSQPRKTWMPAGTIEAIHEEYRAAKTTDANQISEQIIQKIQEYQADPNKPERTESLQKMRLDAIPFNVRSKLSNDYMMSSTVLVRFDGERFYWEINVDSRTDSVQPGRDLSGNFMTRHFDLNWNARRIFVWDGEKYTTYSLPGNCATVDSTGATPHFVNGPLTAGLIPWGYGHFTYEKLSAAESSGVETNVDGQTQIHMTISNSDGSEVRLALDPTKDYAAISCSTTRPGNLLVSNQYSNHQFVSGRWVPTAIVTDKYDATSYRLLARDSWDFTGISGDAPGPGSFDVEYEADALVEYSSILTDEPLIYHCSQLIDWELLLSERLSIAASEGTQARNCATVALQYATTQLGKDVAESQLGQLISEPNGETSLYAMKTFAEGLGLHCRAITTDIQTLKMLGGCQTILHIPGKKHFVVLGGIDNDSVWTIDLTSKTFLRRTDLSFFGLDWTEGTALVISDEPIDLRGDYTELDDSRLESIIGRAGYSCTRLIQSHYRVQCIDGPTGCDDWYEYHPKRMGCEAAESGSCRGLWLLRYWEAPCYDSPWYPPGEMCEIGSWNFYYMRACE